MADVGLKVTVIEQLEPAPKDPPQPPVTLKGALAVMLLMVRVALPVFVKVVDCDPLVVPTGTLPKLMDGPRLTAGAGETPVPSSGIDGEPPMSVVTERLEDWAPPLVGANVTSIEQLFPAVNVPRHPCVALNAPPAPIVLTVTSSGPLLERVACWAELVCPTCTLPKLSPPDGERSATAARAGTARRAATNTEMGRPIKARATKRLARKVCGCRAPRIWFPMLSVEWRSGVTEG